MLVVVVLLTFLVGAVVVISGCVDTDGVVGDVIVVGCVAAGVGCVAAGVGWSVPPG